MMTRRRMLTLCAASVPLTAQAPRQVKSLKVTLLTTMLADGRGIGEWGFAAMVEVDGHRILFDTGGRPDTLVINARELGVDLNGIPDVILSHNHGDHTTGLVTVREQLAKGITIDALGCFTRVVAAVLFHLIGGADDLGKVTNQSLEEELVTSAAKSLS